MVISFPCEKNVKKFDFTKYILLQYKGMFSWKKVWNKFVKVILMGPTNYIEIPLKYDLSNFNKYFLYTSNICTE